MAVKTLLFLFFLLSGTIVAVSQPGPTGKDAVWRVEHTDDFELTGDGSSSNWASVDWVPMAWRQGNSDQYHTEGKLLYSDNGIYFLIHCEDKKITSTLREDFTPLFKEDVVEAFFWTDESVPIYLEYELSPMNYELVLLIPNLGKNFGGWIPWHYEGRKHTRHNTHINDDGSWTAECFIPYPLMNPLQNVPPQKGTRWRGNLYRLDYDAGETRWSWQPTRVNFHDYQSFGTLLFD